MRYLIFAALTALILGVCASAAVINDKTKLALDDYTKQWRGIAQACYKSGMEEQRVINSEMSDTAVYNIIQKLRRACFVTETK